MPEGGRLRIETASENLGEAGLEDLAEARLEDFAPRTYVALRVADTGCGIASEHLDRVFEPFFTTKPAGKGSGLGLSMVYGFVKQSGGHIRIRSETGAGTTVEIYLPVAERDVAGSLRDQTSRTAPSSTA